MTPLSQSVQPEVHEWVPSPTSALSEEQQDPNARQELSSEGVQLQFTEVRSAGDLQGAYAGCEWADWF